jgi:hypothetical protein
MSSKNRSTGASAFPLVTDRRKSSANHQWSLP